VQEGVEVIADKGVVTEGEPVADAHNAQLAHPANTERVEGAYNLAVDNAIQLIGAIGPLLVVGEGYIGEALVLLVVTLSRHRSPALGPLGRRAVGYHHGLPHGTIRPATGQVDIAGFGIVGVACRIGPKGHVEQARIVHRQRGEGDTPVAAVK